MKEPLCGLMPADISRHLQLNPTFRGKQIYKWIHSGISDFESMHNIPKDLRSYLSEKAIIFSTSVDKISEDKNKTVKLGIKLKDGLLIEAVLLKDLRDRQTACLSSQAGCGMGCTFCKTASMGLKRNLTAGEIVEQFLHLKKRYGHISNIVFMGMGEPLANIENVRKAVEIIHDPDGENIGKKKITISTCGIVNGIYDIADNGPDIQLAVSLITANQEKRDILMPVTENNPLDTLQNALIYYQKKKKDRITLEYVLIDDVNDGKEDVLMLKQFIQPLNSVVNLIPWNPVEEIALKEPDSGKIIWFLNELEKNGIPVTQRFKRGRSINGACGQLAT